MDLFGFIISTGNEPPRHRGDVRRICSSRKKVVFFFVKQRAYNLFLLLVLSVKKFSCFVCPNMWHIFFCNVTHKKDMKAFNLFN